MPLNVFDLKNDELGIAFQILNKPKNIEFSNYKFIKIDTSNVKTLKFKVNYGDKAKLFENGYLAGINFIENYYKN